MGRKTKFMAKKRLDKYYRLAKDEGYASRAAFKLLQINKEFDFLGQCRCLLDLCAAPGGWTQVAAKHMPLSSLIVAADLAKMKPVGGAKVIQGDIFTQQCKYDIKKALQGWKCDAVIHDGAPNISGTWNQDAYGQCRLTLQSLKLATEFLRPGGLFITKIFRSADYNALLWVANHFFENVVTFKPKASRASSAEIYWICKNYLAPKKIDPRLLDPKFAFREIDPSGTGSSESISVMRLRKGKKERRNRSGYAEGLEYLGTSTSVLDFLRSDRPEAILGDYHKFIFDHLDGGVPKKAQKTESERGEPLAMVDEAAKEQSEVENRELSRLVLSNEKLTTEEIKFLLSDLKVLGKVDFRKLLRWRLKVNKYLEQITGSNLDPKVQRKAEFKAEKQAEEDKEENKSEEQQMREEVRELLAKKKREERKKKRKVRQAKIKDTRTMLMGGLKPGDSAWDTSDSQRGMFSLSEMKNDEQLAAFAGRVYKPKSSENGAKKKHNDPVSNNDGGFLDDYSDLSSSDDAPIEGGEEEFDPEAIAMTEDFSYESRKHMNAKQRKQAKKNDLLDQGIDPNEGYSQDGRKFTVGQVTMEEELEHLEDNLDTLFLAYKRKRSKLTEKNIKTYIEKRLDMNTELDVLSDHEADVDDDDDDDADEEEARLRGLGGSTDYLSGQKARVERMIAARGGGLILGEDEQSDREDPNDGVSDDEESVLDSDMDDDGNAIGVGSDPNISNQRNRKSGKPMSQAELTKARNAEEWFADSMFDSIQQVELDDGRTIEIRRKREESKQKTNENSDSDDDSSDAADLLIKEDWLEAARKDKERLRAERIANYPKPTSRRGRGLILTDLDQSSSKDGSIKLKSRLAADDILPDILKIPYKVQRKMKKMNRDKRRRLAREEEERKKSDAFFEEVAVGFDVTGQTGKSQKKKRKRLELDSDEEVMVAEEERKQLKRRRKNDENGDNDENYDDGSEHESGDDDDENEEEESDEKTFAVWKRDDDQGSESESSDDSEAIAETIALGQQLIKKKKRADLIDDSYAKYSFNDNDDEKSRLPDWFKEDESQAYTVNLPVTKQEMDEIRARMKAVNARPIKKIAEAKARKKLKAMRAWNRVQKAATGIANSTEISERSKIKQIQALYAKHNRNAKGRLKNNKVYVVGKGRGRSKMSKKDGVSTKGAAKIHVDKRLKKDKVGRKRQAVRAKMGVNRKQRGIRHMKKHKRR